jgi:hypothetical protein
LSLDRFTHNSDDKSLSEATYIDIATIYKKVMKKRGIYCHFTCFFSPEEGEKWLLLTSDVLRLPANNIELDDEYCYDPPPF